MVATHRADDSRAFADRRSAGIALAAELRAARLSPPLMVLGLPRGGVPVAYEVARGLDAPLDVLAVRKIGLPEQPEYAIGAIAAGGIVVRDPDFVTPLETAGIRFEQLVRAEQVELARRERLYRGAAAPLELADRVAILVDDGLATGLTMLAAVRSAREAHASRIIVAAPVASREACAMLAREADEVIALITPDQFRAVGEWYERFEQLEDEEVLALLKRAGPARSSAPLARRTT
jgi:predicted phosphoribosyltransferase